MYQAESVTNTLQETETARSHIRVFISHSHEDAKLARLLVALLVSSLKLNANTIRCTSVDGFRLSSGSVTDEQLKSEVVEADAFVGIVSSASLSSHYVIFELGARWGCGKMLRPLLTPSATMKMLKGPLPSLSMLRSNNESQLRQFISDVANDLNITWEPDIDHTLVNRILAYPTDDQLEKVEICQAWKVLPYLPIYIALHKGFFEQEGLSVSVVEGGGDDLAWESVKSGKSHFGVGDPTIMMRDQGSRAPEENGKVVAAILNKNILWGVTRKRLSPILEAKHFRGRKIACYPPPSTASVMVEYLKQKSGSSSDVNVQNVRPRDEFRLLDDDESIDIVISTEPMITKAELDGCRVVWSGPRFFGDFLITGLYSRRQTILERPDLVQKMVSAIDRALVFLSTNHLEALGIAMHEFSEDEMIATEIATLRLLAAQAYPMSAAVSEKAWHQCMRVRFGIESGSYSFSDWVDNRFAIAAKQTRSR